MGAGRSQVKISATSATALGGVVIHSDGAGSMYYYDAGGVLFKVVAGTLNFLITGMTAAAPGDTVDIERSGGDVVCKLNGTTVGSITDSSFTTGDDGVAISGGVFCRLDDWTNGVASDDFNRANGSPGSNWSQDSVETDPLVIDSNTLMGTTNGVLGVIRYVGSGSNVTVSLTGQAASSAAGSLSIAQSAVLTGSSVSSATGTISRLASSVTAKEVGSFGVGAFAGGSFAAPYVLAPQSTSGLTVTLSGQLASSSTGSLGKAIATALSGQLATPGTGLLSLSSSVSVAGSSSTVSTGLLSPSLSASVTGSQLSFTAGSVSPGLNISLLGQGVTLASGVVTATAGGNVTVSLSGASAIAIAGALSANSTLVMTGTSAALSAGQILAGVSGALSGSSVTVSSGSVGLSRNIGVNGASVGSSTGSLSPGVSVTTTGTLVNAVTGSVTTNFVASLTGQPLTLATGSVIVTSGGNVTVNLSGSALSTLTGLLNSSRALSVTGASVSAASGVMSVQSGVPIAGQPLSVSVGSLQALHALTLLGTQVAISTGALTASTTGSLTIALSGSSLSSQVGQLLVARGLLLSGEQVNITLGSIVVGSPAVIPPVPYGAPEARSASANPYSSSATFNVPMRAGSDGLIVGRFAWIDVQSSRVTNVYSSGLPVAFVPAVQSVSRLLYLEAGLLKMRAGYQVTLASGGDFWARFAYGATAGDRVYASTIDGSVVSGQRPDTVPTQWKVATSAEPGELAIITTSL